MTIHYGHTWQENHNTMLLSLQARVLFNLQYLDDAIFLTRRSLEVQPPDQNAWQQHFQLGEILKVRLVWLTLVFVMSGRRVFFPNSISRLDSYLVGGNNFTNLLCNFPPTTILTESLSSQLCILSPIPKALLCNAQSCVLTLKIYWPGVKVGTGKCVASSS